MGAEHGGPVRDLANYGGFTVTGSRIHHGDCRTVLEDLASESVDCIVTSPPYWGLRQYGEGDEREIGNEPTPYLYVENLLEVFRSARRVLRHDGTLWLNLGDTYITAAGRVRNCPGGGFQGRNWAGPMTQPNRMPQEGLKARDLAGIPWRVALALQADGWYLRSDIVWSKPNPQPESVEDRPSRAHEYIFLFAKSEIYHYDHEAVKEAAVGDRGYETRNRRSVWTVAVHAYEGSHRATFPPELIKPCILAGCPVGGVVLDPFSGAGTTGLVANNNGRNYVGIELYEASVNESRQRIAGGPLLAGLEIPRHMPALSTNPAGEAS